MYCTLCVYSIYRRTVQHRRPSCRIISDNNVHIFPYRMEQTNVSKKHGQSHRNGRRILLTIELLIYKYKLWNKVLLWICPKVFVVHSNVSSTSWNRTFIDAVSVISSNTKYSQWGTCTLANDENMLRSHPWSHCMMLGLQRDSSLPLEWCMEIR